MYARLGKVPEEIKAWQSTERKYGLVRHCEKVQLGKVLRKYGLVWHCEQLWRGKALSESMAW